MKFSAGIRQGYPVAPCVLAMTYGHDDSTINIVLVLLLLLLLLRLLLLLSFYVYLANFPWITPGEARSVKVFQKERFRIPSVRLFAGWMPFLSQLTVSRGLRNRLHAYWILVKINCLKPGLFGVNCQVMAAVASGGDLTKADRYGWTTLHHAAICGHADVVGYILNSTLASHLQ